MFFILAISYVFFSCQDEQLVIDPPPEIAPEAISSNLMSFDSKDDYTKVFEDETYLANKIDEMEFISLQSKIAGYDVESTSARTIQTLENPADTIYDDYGVLAEILNENKIVKIGNHIIKVDLHTEQVLVLNSKYNSEYSDLVSNNFDNEHIMVFSTEDEVLTLLEEGSGGTINARELSCSAQWAGGDPITRHPARGRRHRLKAKLTYQKAGIYFSLLAKGKTQKRRFRVWWRDYGGRCTIYYNCKFGVRCGYSYNRVSSQGSSRGEANFRPHESWNALEYYYLLGQFRSTNGNVDLLIQDNY